MKKTLIVACAVMTATFAVGQTFQNGDRIVNAGIGIGVIKDVGPTFTQKVGIEWGVMSIGDRGTIGIGVALHNAIGGVTDEKVYGTYDYKVKTTSVTYSKNDHNRWMLTSDDGSDMHRSGFGSADAKLAREDLKALVSCSYHYAINNKLEAYGSVGIGAALINGLCGNYKNYDGFEVENHKSEIDTNTKKTQHSLIYSYNDIEHADFSGYKYTKLGLACEAAVGVRYTVKEKLFVFGETGLVCSALKKGYAKGLDLFTIGVTFKW